MYQNSSLKINVCLTYFLHFKDNIWNFVFKKLPKNCNFFCNSEQFDCSSCPWVPGLQFILMQQNLALGSWIPFLHLFNSSRSLIAKRIFRLHFSSIYIFIKNRRRNGLRRINGIIFLIWSSILSEVLKDTGFEKSFSLPP